ncbi:hypothetical protein FPV82_17525 [Vibrio cholerae]|nr:hypothetical protein DLR74_05970 [Vibrio paracholerae]TVM52664.1 hypothetical protein FPV38_13225 [Vibrio cholerae]TVM99415.1 hypothetical protein FPV82_17525 [Vibrio cholerae]
MKPPYSWRQLHIQWLFPFLLKAATPNSLGRVHITFLNSNGYRPHRPIDKVENHWLGAMG